MLRWKARGESVLEVHICKDANVHAMWCAVHHVVPVVVSRKLAKKAVSRLTQIFLIFFPTHFHFNGQTIKYKFK